MNLKETSDNIIKTKLALEELRIGQNLRIIIGYDPTTNGVSKTTESEGHRILEVKRLNQTDWEMIIQKSSGNYTI